MASYAVSVVLDDDVDVDVLSAHFFGEFDGLLCKTAGIPRACVYWSADSGGAAAQEVVIALERALSARVARVDPELVTTRDIADRIGKTQQPSHSGPAVFDARTGSRGRSTWSAAAECGDGAMSTRG